VRTDSGLVLAAPSLITLATKRTLDLPTRPANLLDNYGERLEGFVQLVGAETLKVISAERNECGCVSRVDWDPLVVAPPLNLATVYAIDSNPGAVLVSGELAAHLRGTDARIKLALVYF
jgi:hypothetical protein